MTNEPEPDVARLASARGEVQTFLVKKERFAKQLWVLAGLFEALFFVLMLAFMDFGDPLYRFLFVGILLVYTPIITFTWRNAVKIDHLYYRLIDELKYGD
jgi:hypothetical protein